MGEMLISRSLQSIVLVGAGLLAASPVNAVNSSSGTPTAQSFEVNRKSKTPIRFNFINVRVQEGRHSQHSHKFSLITQDQVRSWVSRQYSNLLAKNAGRGVGIVGSSSPTLSKRAEKSQLKTRGTAIIGSDVRAPSRKPVEAEFSWDKIFGPQGTSTNPQLRSALEQLIYKSNQLKVDPKRGILRGYDQVDDPNGTGRKATRKVEIRFTPSGVQQYTFRRRKAAKIASDPTSSNGSRNKAASGKLSKALSL